MSEKPKLKKVFFIDDDEATNAFHKALAADFGLAQDVQLFEDAQEAIKALNSIEDKYEFPELIFVDINMPKIDGHEFATKVQDMPGYNENRTCIALLTNSKDIRDVVKADENSVEYYYWKPLSSEMLENILHKDMGLD